MDQFRVGESGGFDVEEKELTAVTECQDLGIPDAARM
jgi:hypothetical protein